MIDVKYIERIASELSLTEAQAAKAIEFLDAGMAAPFVARYRRDATGNLSEAQLDRIARGNGYYLSLSNRRNAIVQALDKQGVLTPEFREKLEAAEDKAALDDFYLPFKSRRPTKATMAREKGLQPLADRLMRQDPADHDIAALAAGFISAEKGVSSAEEALEGAGYILSEQIVMDPEARGLVRAFMLREGRITSHSTKNAEGKRTKFEAYYEFTEPVAMIPSHRLLAILRGVRAGVLRMDLALADEPLIAELVARYVQDAGSAFDGPLRQAAEDAYRRHLRPGIEHEVIEIARKHAEEEAVRVFADNTRSLLLSPPAGRIVVLGVEPGLRTGCKLAVIDGLGGLLETREIRPLPPDNDAEAAERTVAESIERHRPKAIAIGNGTAARETAQFFHRALAKNETRDITCALINAAGASFYASSKDAHEEFPELDASTRGAIATARYLQDPLAELVKVDPRQIGVGQYHHDVNQRHLRDELHRTLVSCVSHVGVDLNRASAKLLRYVCGLGMGTAQNIVMHREKIGGFRSRRQLLDVEGVTEKAFEQCAGFVFVHGGDNPLDETGIHPESYGVVEKIAASLGVTLDQLVRNRDLLETADFPAFGTDTTAPYVLEQLRVELLHPHRDPRGKFRAPKFIDGAAGLDDLKEGMEMEGVVTNVTDFGAFVDIGMSQDGLVHLSQMAKRFISDPREVVKVGEIVKVRIIKIDKDAPRISLSMKAVAPPARKRPPRPMPKREAADQPEGSPEAGTEGPPRRESRRPRPAWPEGDRPPDRGRRPRMEGERERAPRAPFPERRGDRPRPDDAQRRRPERKREQQRPPMPVAPSEPLNTLLADQLAAFRERFK